MITAGKTSGGAHAFAVSSFLGRKRKNLMSESVAIRAPRVVLADLAAHTRARSAVLVVTGTLLVAVASQIRIPLGFTPVPINGGTFAVMVVGAALGARRGGLALLLFLVGGLVGMPFFAGGGSGWQYVTGATGGYLVAYVLAAVLLGCVAERGVDRRVRTAVPAMLVATAVIYTMGAAWLAIRLGVPFLGREGSAWSMGVQPFLVGDVLKLVLAGLVLPAAWRLVGDHET